MQMHPPEPIVVGFVNNMPDAALRNTERQFLELLLAAPQGPRVRLRRFYIPSVPRTDELRGWLERHYESTDALTDEPLDGLIVTGAEPKAPELTGEPYWQSLGRLIDWAEDNTTSTIWSCLAAHAAVLHLDGIRRFRLGKKLSGVFASQPVSHHPLMAGMPAEWEFPHSRYNGLPADELARAGYMHLSHSPEAGVDVFMRQNASLFLFLHGHPEYDPDSLFREYRRDVSRFLSREREEYPEPPRNYFEGHIEVALAAYRERAFQERTPDILPALPARMGRDLMAQPWRGAASGLFANWLDYLAARKVAETPIHLMIGTQARAISGRA